MDWQRWARAVVIGRPNGIRATVRKQTGWFTWLDESPDAPPAPPPSTTPVDDAGWEQVLSVDELDPDAPVEVFVGGEPVVVVSLDDGVYALAGTCVHAGGPMAEGTLEDGILTCPWHGWTFDVRSGITPMREGTRLRTYEVRVTGEAVWVRL